MHDYVIDTNVLLVASAKHPGSPYQDSNVPAAQALEVLNWLMKFRANDQGMVVLDSSFRIWAEYHNKMTRGQDLGSLVVTEKLQRSMVRLVDVAYDGQGHACLPDDLEKVVHDRSDRKFVAVARNDLAQGHRSTIVNAVDTDWCAWEKPLKAAGIKVIHLIEGLCKERQRGGRKR